MKKLQLSYIDEIRRLFINGMIGVIHPKISEDEIFIRLGSPLYKEVVTLDDKEKYFSYDYEYIKIGFVKDEMVNLALNLDFWETHEREELKKFMATIGISGMIIDFLLNAQYKDVIELCNDQNFKALEVIYRDSESEKSIILEDSGIYLIFTIDKPHVINQITYTTKQNRVDLSKIADFRSI